MTMRGYSNLKRVITRFENKHNINLRSSNYYDFNNYNPLDYYLFRVRYSELEKGFSIKFDFKRSYLRIFCGNKLLAFCPLIWLKTKDNEGFAFPLNMVR